MSEPLSFTYEALPGRVVFGAGAARDSLAAEIERLGTSRLLLVAGGTSRELAEELVAPLGELVAARFDAVRPHVPAEVAAAAVAAARGADADAVLCIGGGSTTGTAKAVALATGLPIVAVPTTYAGSEMTPVWGSTEAGKKTTGRDPRVLPRVVVYDPELTLALPPSVSAASGMNALAHCVEALYAEGHNPITALVAEEGIRTLAAALPGVVAEPEDLEARTGALYGAYLAGAAFAVAGSGLHHRICHVLGGAFDLPHAETHSIVLPQVVAFEEPAVPELMGRVAAALGAGEERAASALYELAAGMGLPLALRDLGGMPEQGIDEVVPAIVAASPSEYPRAVDEGGVLEILEAAYRGAEP